MKKLLSRLTLICFLAFSAGSMGNALAQFDYEAVTAPDTVVVQDVDPRLFAAEGATGEKGCKACIYIAIAVAAVAAGVICYKVACKKKKE